MLKDKDKIKTYIDITKATIGICWVSLFAFWTIKLFGGNFFEIVVQNENFIAFSNLVETTWIKYLVSLFTIGVANYLMIGAICQKFYFKGTQALIIALAIISMWAVANFVPVSFLSLPIWYGYVILIFIGAYFNKGIARINGMVSILLEFCFSTISMFVKNISIAFMNGYIFTLIFSIDLYIMTILYYLYSNLIKLKKEH